MPDANDLEEVHRQRRAEWLRSTAAADPRARNEAPRYADNPLVREHMQRIAARSVEPIPPSLAAAEAAAARARGEMPAPGPAEAKGLPVAGYTSQPAEKIALVNEHKEMEEMLLRRMDSLQGRPDIDGRWLAIARTDLERGFMMLNRAVFQPQRIALPEDKEMGA